MLMLLLMEAAAAVAKGHSSATRTSSGRISARALALVDRRMFVIDPVRVPRISRSKFCCCDEFWKREFYKTWKARILV